MTQDDLLSPTGHHVDFDLEGGRSSINDGHSSSHSIRSEPDLDRTPSSILRRRGTRLNAFRTVETTPLHPNWRPGQEPGLDPLKKNGGREQTPEIHEECQITVVDYSQNDMVLHDLNNAQLIEFLQRPKEKWIGCRWINVNGLSWDVVQAIGKYRKLHKLAIEDLFNTSNRTKVDW